ncbi:DUF2336 domain-containing protein [Terrarubrum flagellatum]|uniref:DUF2336 domain-containing protein n=1 Tax=Terrirubrum flagellatum TaxID=2895980 RepID=UPI00314550E2
MIVRRFLEWSQTAPAGQRAEAASALARAYLYSELEPADRDEALAALAIMLDDGAPPVRRALAETFASAADAPVHIIISLSNDQSEIAAPVLARSPVLLDSDLIDSAAIGDAAARLAIAGRARLSAGVCAAMAEIGEPESLVEMLRNPGAEIPDFAYRRMIERHGAEASLREEMLHRSDLSAGVRHMLVVAVSDALSQFVQTCAWMRPERGERVMAEAREAAAVAIAEKAGDCEALARHLCASRQLTAGLLLRALLSGRVALLEAALSQLSGQPSRRVAGILSQRRGGGFAALYRQAGLPQGLFRAFDAAIAAWRDLGADGEFANRPAALSRRMIERTLTALDGECAAENMKLFALLRRYEAEATREEARAFMAEVVHAPFDELEFEIKRLVDEQAALAA